MRDIETETAAEVFRRIERNGIDRLYHDLLAKSKFKKKKKTKKHITGRFEKPEIVLPLEACLRGWVVSMWESDYLEFILNSFSLHTQGALVDNLYIFDLDTGELLDTIEFSAAASGRHTFDIPALDREGHSSCDRLFVAYDAANVQSIHTEPKKYGSCLPSCMSCGCLSTGGSSYKMPYTGLVEDLQPCFDDLEKEEDIGLILDFKVVCSFQKWLCECAAELAPILRLAMGLQYFEEINGILGELNKLTLLPEETKNAITDGLKDQYDVALNDFLSSLQPDCCCFEHDALVCKKPQLP